RRLELTNPQRLARYLLLCSALTVGSMLVFGLSRTFTLALVAFWLLSAVGTLAGPLAQTWLNGSLESRSRATVLSMVSQADALGQLTGG
ncbi:MFS transporter, partial [Staphylococcus aureus]|nr:MFS transporter [Staphylococcus aureus]